MESGTDVGQSWVRHRGQILVTFAAVTVNVASGTSLTVGRSTTCDLRLPPDDHVSRRAFELRVVDDYVLIRNLSTSKPVVLRPEAGQDTVIEPSSATTSLPHRRFSLVLAGKAGTPIEIDVDACRLAPQLQSVADSTTRTSATMSAPLELTAAQHRILATLCAPLLTRRGAEAVPATYQQIGSRLGLKPQYVRNVIKTVREQLAGCGVPGLTPDDTATTHDDFRASLARWALRSGWVTLGDVGRLPASEEPHP